MNNHQNTIFHQIGNFLKSGILLIIPIYAKISKSCFSKKNKLYNYAIMKKLFALLITFSLLFTSLASVTHAYAETIGDGKKQSFQTVKNNSLEHANKTLVECHQCHAGSHLALSSLLEHTDYSVVQQNFHSSNIVYLSQINTPPLQPPQV